MAVEITEVRIKLMEDAGERLHAFCSITFDDCFVIRDLKIIEGTNGPFVAMPSRKLTSHCPQCGYKNHLRAQFCNQCGQRQKDDRALRDEDGRAKLYADIAHPINSRCREMIQDHVIRMYQEELERSRLPGYVSRYEDFDDEPRSSPAPDENARPADRPYTAARGNMGRDGSPGEQTKVEPAAQEPRAPHKAPASQRTRHGEGPNRGTFGAGIL
jgi:stage V sporulation protein G